MVKAVIALSCKCPHNSILCTYWIFRFKDIKLAKTVWHGLNKVCDITGKLIYTNQEGTFYEDGGIWGGLRVFRTLAVSRNITLMSTSTPVNLSPSLSSALGCACKQFYCTLATCCLSILLGTCPAGTVCPFISSCCHFHHTEWLLMLTFNRPSLMHLLMVYILSFIIFMNRSMSVTHKNKVGSNYHHKFSNAFWIQLFLTLVNTMNLISSVSFNSSSMLSINNYNFSLFNRVQTYFQKLV